MKKMNENPLITNKNEYEEMLRKAVVEIQTARNSIAKHVNSSTNSVYWNLGKLVSEKHLQERFGLYSLPISKVKGSTVYAIEPTAKNFWKLQQNILIQNLSKSNLKKF